MSNDEFMKLWTRCLEIFRDNVTPHTFDVWFSKIVPLSFENKELTVMVGSHFFVEYLEQNYLDLIQKTLYKIYGNGTKLMYKISVVNDTEKDSTVSIPSTTDTSSEVSEKNVQTKDIPQPNNALDSRLIPRYNFSTYIEGESNKLPRSVGDAIARDPGKTFSPFFIYGGSGVGKTHLVNAIGLKAKELHPEMRVLYVSAHLFQVQYTDSVRNNTVNDFINFYQSIDVLIIDDIQELAGMAKTQNTFFHIFNQLHQNGRQIIMTSDRSPIVLQGMEERLLTRFKWGMVTELQAPDAELRKSILRNLTQKNGLKFPEDVMDFISSHIKGIRDLEGIMASMVAHSTMSNCEIDLRLAESVIGAYTKIEKKPLTIEHIIQTVCRQLGLDEELIHDKSRKREIVQARQIAMYIAKNRTDYSAAKIGKLIGGRDHATVLHACKTVREQSDVDRHFKAQVEEIESMLS